MEGFKGTMKLVFLTVLLGSLFGIMFYDRSLDEINVFNETNNFYFLQKGSFSSPELVRANTGNLNTKLVIEDDGTYNVFVAITRDSNVRDRIIEIYREKNIELHTLEKNLRNMEFQKNIDQFDLLLRNSTSFEEINSISAVALSNYEQTMKKD